MTKKRNQKFDLKTAAQLQAEIEDLQIQLALRRMEEAAYEKIANEESGAFCREEIEMKEPPKVEWNDSQREEQRPGPRIPLRVVGVCAACLMLFLAGAGAGIAATNYMQRQAGAFVTNLGSEAINFQFQTVQEPISVPAQWKGEYFPSYIPEGFVLIHIGNGRAYYKNAERVQFIFEELDTGISLDINSENAIITHERAGMRMVTVSEMENSAVVVLGEGDKILVVSVTDIDSTGYESKVETLKIAESIVMLK